jgi:hypothetical protein
MHSTVLTVDVSLLLPWFVHILHRLIFFVQHGTGALVEVGSALYCVVLRC